MRVLCAKDSSERQRYSVLKVWSISSSLLSHWFVIKALVTAVRVGSFVVSFVTSTVFGFGVDVVTT